MEDFYELLVLQKVNHGIHKGLNLKILPFLGDEVQIDQKRIIFSIDLDSVNNLVVVRTARLFAHITYLPRFQYQQIELVLERLYDFLRVGDHHLYLLGQGKQGFLDQAVEKGQVLEDVFVRLTQNLSFKAVWEFLYKVFFLLEVELFLYIYRLMNVVIYLLVQLIRQFAFVHHFLKDFEVFAFLDVLSPNISNQIANTVDVVSKSQAANGFNENQADRFLVGCSNHIPKTHSQHDVNPPVISPNVPFAPISVVYLLHYHPITGLVDFSHHNQQNSQEVSKAKVEYECFDEGPILLIIVVLNQIDFKFLQFLEELTYLIEPQQPHEAEDRNFSRNSQNYGQNVDQIQHKVILNIPPRYLSQSRNLSPINNLHLQEVDNHLPYEHCQRKDLKDQKLSLFCYFRENQSQGIHEKRSHYVEDVNDRKYLISYFRQLKAFVIKNTVRVHVTGTLKLNWLSELIISFQLLHKGLLESFYLLVRNDVLQLEPFVTLFDHLRLQCLVFLCFAAFYFLEPCFRFRLLENAALNHLLLKRSFAFQRNKVGCEIILDFSLMQRFYTSYQVMRVFDAFIRHRGLFEEGMASDLFFIFEFVFIILYFLYLYHQFIISEQALCLKLEEFYQINEIYSKAAKIMKNSFPTQPHIFKIKQFNAILNKESSQKDDFSPEQPLFVASPEDKLPFLAIFLMKCLEYVVISFKTNCNPTWAYLIFTLFIFIFDKCLGQLQRYNTKTDRQINQTNRQINLLCILTSMYIRLKQKPFYFLTDRDTKYTYLVQNKPELPKKHLYLPTHFETKTAKELRSYKWSLVQQLMYWSLFNSNKMTVTDKKICYSKMVDLGVTFLGGLICGSFLRRALFRIQFPFLELSLQGSAFSSRWIKSIAAYSVASVITYKAVGGILKEQYLVDLALQYKYNFVKNILSDCEVEGLLNQLSRERFDGKSKSGAQSNN